MGLALTGWFWLGQLVKVSVWFSVCLLVCWLPYISVCLYETISGQQSPAVTSALSAWLVLTSAALDPWITCMTQT